MTTTADEAYRMIHRVLVSGEFQPGQKVSQIDLARQLGCSTVPVVEAMRRLESEGLLVKEPRRMARVRELSDVELEELYQLREALEGLAARLCAVRITAAQILELQELDERFEATRLTGKVDENTRLDVAIHKLIAEASGNSLLNDELSRMLLIERTAGRRTADILPESPRRSRHTAIVQAVADHDPHAAEFLMKKHIQTGYRETV